MLFSIGPSASTPAADDTDFLGTGTFSQSQLEFGPGQSESGLFGIYLAGDAIPESNEKFLITLDAVNGDTAPIDPAASQIEVTIVNDDLAPAAANDTFRGNIGGSTYIDYSELLANDTGVSNITDVSYLPDGSFNLYNDASFGVIRLEDLGNTPRNANFSYVARDTAGNPYMANVTVALGNHLPVASAQTLYVTPGVANRFNWADIVRIPANADPDGDTLTLAFYNGTGTGPFGSLTGFGDADLGGIVFTPVAGYTGGFNIDYAITDVADLGGARSQPPFPSAQPLFATAKLNFAIAPPSVEMTAWSDATEGNVSPTEDGVLTFTLTRRGDARLPMEVVYSVDGFGPNPADRFDVQTFNVDGTTTATASFAAGQTSLVVPIRVNADTQIEPMEQVLISLISARTLDSEDGLISGGPASIVNERYTWLTIFNDDVLPPPTIALSSADPITIPEGPTTRFTHALMFTLHRSGNLAESSNFTFTLTPELGSSLTTEDIGGIYLGSQYVGSGLGSFTGDFPAGLDVRYLTIFVTTDRVPEPDESFRLTLTGASGATLSATGPLSAVGNISNDDVYPTIGWAATSGGSTPEGSDPSFRGLLEFEITRSGDLSYTSTVTFSVGPGAGGTTADDLDVVGVHGTSIGGSGFGTYTVSFAPDQATARVFLLAAGDLVPEADESVVLTLLSATEGTLVQPDARVATGRITNDDVPNQAPIANDDVLNVLVPFGTTEVIIPNSDLTANDRDPDGSFISMVGITNGVGALVDEDEGHVRLRDITHSIVTFSYDVRNANNATDTASVTVNLSFATNPIQPPTDIALSNARIYENMPADSLIGLLSGVDPDNGDSLTFSFAPNSNSLGLFKIDGNQLRTTASLDYEIANSHALDLRVTDASGNSFDKAFNIAVDDVSERPGSGNDVIMGTLLKDVLRSRGGDDQVFALNGNDSVFGGSGNDTLFGGEGDDSLNGESGLDQIYGEAGSDTLKGGSGNDYLNGGDGTDSLNGENGADQLYGEAGIDHIKGGFGNDFLSGGDDNDTRGGQEGSDTLVGGAGNDILDGGAGKDLYLYLASALGTDDLVAGTKDLVKASKGDKIGFTIDAWDKFGLTNGALSKNIDNLNTLAFNTRQIQIDVNGDGAFSADLDMSIDLVGVSKVTADVVGHFLILG